MAILPGGEAEQLLVCPPEFPTEDLVAPRARPSGRSCPRFVGSGPRRRRGSPFCPRLVGSGPRRRRGSPVARPRPVRAANAAAAQATASSASRWRPARRSCRLMGLASATRTVLQPTASPRAARGRSGIAWACRSRGAGTGSSRSCRGARPSARPRRNLRASSRDAEPRRRHATSTLEARPAASPRPQSTLRGVAATSIDYQRRRRDLNRLSTASPRPQSTLRVRAAASTRPRRFAPRAARIGGAS